MKRFFVLWTLWEREKVGRFGRMALKHVKYHVRSKEKKKKKEESSDRQQKAILRSMSDIDLIKFNDFLNYQKLEYIRSLCFCDLMKHTKI